MAQIFLGGASPYSVVWNFGDQTTNNSDVNPEHTYQKSGIYSIKLTVTDSNQQSISEDILVAIADSNDCSQNCTNEDLTEKYEAGTQACKDDPSSCGLYSQADIDAKYTAGTQACKDDPLSCGIGQNLIFANTANPVLQSGASVNVYGNSEINRVTLKRGASAKLINFVGNNEVTIQSDSNLFKVFRSGATVTIKDSNGTVLTIPATKTPQTILFNDVTLTLLISNNQVMLGNQVVNLTPSPIL